MSFLFFLSYARTDRDRLLERFFSDLRHEVLVKTVIPPSEIGFLDTTSIEMATDWREELSDGLRTSSLCVALCSPRYFNSQYCGKEFQVFSWRRDAWQDEPRNRGRHSQSIFPLLWVPPLDGLPHEVSRFQYTDDEFPAVYAKEGLRYMMKLSRHRDDYKRFVDRLARKVIDAGRETPLPPLADLKPLSEIPNAFAPPAPVYSADMNADGPRNVRFLFAAGCRNEMSAVRKSSHLYGEKARNWQPYPEDKIAIHAFAEESAAGLSFQTTELSLNAEIIDRLRDAERENAVVIILIDPWSLALSEYTLRLKPIDDIYLPNCGVLVAWDYSDVETGQKLDWLRQLMQTVFPRKHQHPPLFHQWHSIQSAADLRSALTSTLEQLRLMVIDLGHVRRQAESTRLRDQAAGQGIALATPPRLNTPHTGVR